jgi:lipopolysaccharide export system permease protein
MAGLALNSAVARNPTMLFFLYGTPVSAIVLSLLVIKRADRQRRPSRIVGLFLDTGAAIWANIIRLVMPRRKFAS